MGCDAALLTDVIATAGRTFGLVVAAGGIAFGCAWTLAAATNFARDFSLAFGIGMVVVSVADLLAILRREPGDTFLLVAALVMTSLICLAFLGVLAWIEITQSID